MFLTSSKSLVLGLIASVSLSLVACGGDVASENSTDGSGEEARPPMPVLSAEGLALDVAERDHVSGRYERDGASIRFDIARDPQRDARHVVIRMPDGAPVFESTLEDGVDQSRFFGGRAEVKGAFGEEPTRTGDPEAIAELGRSAEGVPTLKLKDALEARGIDPALYRYRAGPRVAASEGTIHPNVYTSYGGAPGGTSYPDNQWYFLPAQQTLTFFSWGFWATTAIYASGQHQLSFQAGFARPEYVSSSTTQYYYRQWAGAWVTVKNERYPALCIYSGGRWYCPSSSAWVLVK